MTLSPELSIRCWSFPTGLHFSDLVISLIMILFKICHWHPGRCQGLLQPRQKESSGHRGRQTSSPACRWAGRFWKYPDLRSSTFLFQGFTSPPPREALLELARAKNATQLPLIQVQCIAMDCCNPYLATDSQFFFLQEHWGPRTATQRGPKEVEIVSWLYPPLSLDNQTYLRRMGGFGGGQGGASPPPAAMGGGWG